MQLPSPCLSIRNNRLYIEEVDTTALAEQFGTPLFVISERQLRENVRNWQGALSAEWDNPVNILPSFKANTCLALRHILSEEGAGCDTFGAHELEAALQAGVRPELISVNGSAKNRELLRRAITVGARITLDHANELPLIQQEAADLDKIATIRFRLRLRNPQLTQPTDFMPDVSSNELLRMYKPGIPFETVVALGQQALDMVNVNLVGLHIHIARNSSQLAYWQSAIETLTDMVADLHDAWDGWLPRELDLGGGFSYPHDPACRADERVSGKVAVNALPTPAQYAQTVSASVRAAFSQRNLSTDNMTLEVEPGRAMYGSAGIHLASVCDVKSETDPQPWRWVETDTSDIFLSGINLEHADFPVCVANKAAAEATDSADIVGISCNFDLLVSQAELPSVAAGDLIAFMNTGAYEEANASNFNLLARPATVLVSGDSAEIIRRRETLADILSRDIIPERFRS